MDPLISSSLISGGSGLLGGLFNIGSARRANRRMIDFWKMQNEYNHPKNQMARLQEAGLNPALMYGQSASGATGSAADIGRPERATIDFDNPMQHIAKFQDIKLKSAQENNLNYRNTVLVQDAALKAANVANKNLETAADYVDYTAKREDFDANRKLKTLSVDAAAESLRQSELNTMTMAMDNHVKSQTLKAEIYKSFYQIELMKQTKNMRGAQIELMKQLKFLRANGLDKAPWYGRFVYDQAKDMLPSDIEPTDTKKVLEYLGSSRTHRKSEKWRNKYKPQPNRFSGVQSSY